VEVADHVLGDVTARTEDLDPAERSGPCLDVVLSVTAAHRETATVYDRGRPPGPGGAGIASSSLASFRRSAVRIREARSVLDATRREFSASHLGRGTDRLRHDATSIRTGESPGHPRETLTILTPRVPDYTIPPGRYPFLPDRPARLP